MKVTITIDGQSQTYTADWQVIPSVGDRVRFELPMGQNAYQVQDRRWICGLAGDLQEVEIHLG